MNESRSAGESPSGAADALATGVRKPRPAVVALIGIPGAGKAHVAQALSVQLGLRRVNRDAIRAAMFPQCRYSFAEKARGVSRAATRSRDQLRARRIECHRRREFFRGGATCSASTARYAGMVSCRFRSISTVRSTTARTRITQQLHADPGLARDPDLAAEVRAHFEPPPPNALAINANLPLDEVARIVVAAVAQLQMS